MAASVESAASYVGRSDAADPRLSPVFAPAASLASLPPTLLLVGDAEVTARVVVRVVVRVRVRMMVRVMASWRWGSH